MDIGVFTDFMCTVTFCLRQGIFVYDSTNTRFRRFSSRNKVFMSLSVGFLNDVMDAGMVHCTCNVLSVSWTEQ